MGEVVQENLEWNPVGEMNQSRKPYLPNCRCTLPISFRPSPRLILSLCLSVSPVSFYLYRFLKISSFVRDKNGYDSKLIRLNWQVQSIFAI